MHTSPIRRSAGSVSHSADFTALEQASTLELPSGLFFKLPSSSLGQDLQAAWEVDSVLSL